MTVDSDHNLKRYHALSNLLIEYKTKLDEKLSWLDYGKLEYSCREVACYGYRLDHNIDEFVTCEYKVPDFIIKQYERARETSEDALKAAFTPSVYYRIFHGLAGRNFDGSRRLAKLIIDTGVFKVPPYGYDCDYYGMIMMCLLTGDSCLWTIFEQFRRNKYKKGTGKAFAVIFEGLLNKDVKTAQQGIIDLVKALKRQSKWVDDHIGYLNTWAIGMANLCRLHGVWVEGVAPQVPIDLLIPQEEVNVILKQYPELGKLPPKE
jgi:hypothetical protein